MAKEKSLKKVTENELLDLLENTGILHEVNRTFFHPIGINLVLENDLTLSIEQTDDVTETVMHTVDKMKINAYNKFRNDKHRKRHEMTGFIIQIRDMIRSNKLETSIVDPSVLKLNALLTELDNCIFDIKKRVMSVSPSKDDDLSDFDDEILVYEAQSDVQKGNFIDAAARLMMAERIEKINIKLKKLRELRTNQKKVYKEN